MAQQHWLIRWTDELMRITEDLTQEEAADFVRRVYEDGRAAGRDEAVQEPGR